jgi:hypothetical protein
MTHPLFLYYKERSSVRCYQEKASDSLDLDRFLRGHSDYWLSPFSKEMIKKKRLVLADWSAPSWSTIKLTQVQNKLNALLDEGFEIDLWQENHCVTLNHNNMAMLSSDTVRGAMCPDSSTQVDQVLGLSYEKRCILDDYWLQCLLLDKESLLPRTVSFYEYQHGCYNKKHYLSQAHPPIEWVLDDVLTKENNDDWAYLNSFSANKSVESLYRCINLDPEDIPLLTNEIFIKRASKVERVNCNNDIQLNPENLRCLSKLVTHCHTLDTKTLSQELLSNAKNLENLHLMQCNDLSALDSLKPGELKQLKRIDLSYNSVSNSNLVHILQAAPNLCNICLDFCEAFSEENIHLAAGSLPYVNTLSLESSPITATNLEQLLKATPNLSALKIGNIKQKIDSEFSLDKDSLSRIEYINASNSNAVEGLLTSILKAAPNLKGIGLGSFATVDELYRLDGNSLIKLEEIYLGGNKVSANHLAALANIAPNLKTIALNTMEQTGDYTVLKPNSFPKLEEIQLRSTTMSIRDLAILLTTAPNIRTVYLDDYQPTSDGFCLDPNSLSLPSLENIHLNGSNLSAENFRIFLAAAPQLKEIYFEECKSFHSLKTGSLNQLEVIKLRNSDIAADFFNSFISGLQNLNSLSMSFCNNLRDLKIKPHSLLQLNEVELIGTPLLDSDIKVLLKAAPHIKRLYLNNCFNITELLLFEPRSLIRLEYIDLSNTRMSSSGFQSLLYAAINLKEITLRDCKHLIESFQIEPGLLMQLERLDLSRTSISQSNLKILLLAAPNLQYLELNGCNSSDFEALLTSLPKKIALVLERALSNTRAINGLESEGIKKISESDKKPHDDRNENQDATQDQTEEENTSEHTTNMTYDANTAADDKKRFYLKRFFYPLDGGTTSDITQYRQSVFNTLFLSEEKEGRERPFLLSNEDLEIKPCLVPKALSKNKDLTEALHVAYYDTKLNHHWRSLPSLSPVEKMLSCSVIPNTVQFELGYSSKTNMYYIRTTTNEKATVSIEYTVSVPKMSNCLPQEVLSLMNDFRAFGAGELVLDSEIKYTGQEYVDTIYQQKNGACRHRAVAFKAIMQQKHPEMHVRIVTNHCHAFVEVNANGIYHGCDLGGYPIEVMIEENDKAVSTTIVPSDDIDSCDAEDSLPLVRIQSYIREQLSTWARSEIRTNPLIYFQQCIAGVEAKTRLIELPSNQALIGFRHQLDIYCQNIKKPIFYVHSPDDLICSSPCMTLGNDAIGVVEPGPTGPLHRFLSTHKEGVVLVNYSHFSPEDLVRFNSLLDAVRIADGTNVPEKMVVIGLFNKQSELNPGSDFYSRFDVVAPCYIVEETLVQSIPSFFNQPLEPNGLLINLYHSLDWKSQLLGQWIPNNGCWHYKKGRLHELLEQDPQPASLTLYNGLWDDPDFCHFWQETQLRGEIETPTGVLKWPSSLTLTQADGYDWNQYRQYANACKTMPLSYEILNPSTYSDFFGRYHVKNSHLEATPGFIAAASNQNLAELSVYVTHVLNEDQWAKLLHHAQESNVQLQLYCAPGVVLPKELQLDHEVKQPDLLNFLSGEAVENKVVIESTDIDVTISQCLMKKPQSLVIDISELRPSELISRIDPTMPDEKEPSTYFSFQQRDCVLTQALAKGQHIVLHGYFSAELAESLAPLMMKHPENLTLISEDTSLFSYVSPRHQHTVHPKEKIALLEKALGTIPDPLIPFIKRNDAFSTLMTRGRWLQRHPDGDSQQAWIGLRTIEQQQNDPGVLNASTWKPCADALMSVRKNTVNEVLTMEPYVFLSGLSGVGKSTFVTNELCTDMDFLYHGQEALLAWALDKTNDRRKLLFLDEANLSPSQWSCFEGLYCTPPHIIIKGQYYELEKDHKVIFSGNPLSYGDDRQLAPFFVRHGNSVLFNVLPSEVLYEKVLSPVFSHTPLNEKSALISEPILSVYRFLCLVSKDDVLISPRELQMMALCIVSHCKHHSEAQPEEVAKYIAFHLAKNLVPKEHQELFKQQHGPHKDLTISLSDFPSNNDYLMTPSRREIHDWLDTFLNIRDDRLSATSDSLRYGGLGGLIFEGEPGIGKSEMVSAYLVARGYKEAHDYKNPANDQKSFYRMPVSMSLDGKEWLLRKAFDEAAVVIVDEINSSPMMERLLNALLMGSTPEGTRPNHPGFMMVGTQNPASMAGRRLMSTALQRRMLSLSVPSYSPQEMLDIVMAKGLDFEYANLLVQTYQEQRDFAERNHLTPAPTFRDVLRTVKSLLGGLLKKLSSATIRETNQYSNARLSFFNSAISSSFLAMEETEQKKGGNGFC